MRGYILLTMVVILFAGCAGESCPETFEPVCGEDGETYANACLAEKAGVEIAEQGACAVVPDCDDSDGGKDIFTRGTVNSFGNRFDDKCLDPETVTEQFCDNEVHKAEELPCPAGYECKLGKCGELPCEDSDGGIKPDVKGTVTSGKEKYIDECDDPDTVKEYYCDGNKVSSENKDCGEGEICLGGRCTEYQCADSDGGKDKMEKGTADDGKNTYTDSCIGLTKVKEYYCGQEKIESEEMSCGTGYQCDDGECVELTCTDSDNGKDKYTRGITKYGTDEFEDNCYSSRYVLEYYCASDTSIDFDKIECGSGDQCVLGECVVVECEEETTDIDDEDERYEIDDFGGSDKLRLYKGSSVEINDEMFLRLYQVSGSEATFRLYLDYEDLIGNDDECDVVIEEGNSDDDICGESTGTIEVDTVDDGDDYADIYLDEYTASQYYSQQGERVEYSGSGSCPDDEDIISDYSAFFYPYLDTDSGGLDLDGRRFRLFGMYATIDDIDSNTLSFEFDGDDYDLEDGDTFEYNDREYSVNLVFNDGGVSRLELELD